MLVLYTTETKDSCKEKLCIEQLIFFNVQVNGPLPKTKETITITQSTLSL